MKVDLTVTISVILALCAILSSVFTAAINNRHQLRMKKLELEHQRHETDTLHKRGVFEEYLEKAFRCTVYTGGVHYSEYTEIYLKAVFLAPKAVRDKMIALHERLRSTPSEGTKALLLEIASMLSESLQEE